MSDYTPPTLVIPTPGGNPGDGSLNGALRVQSSQSTLSSINPEVFLEAANGFVLLRTVGNGILRIGDDASGVQIENSLGIPAGIGLYKSINTVGFGVPAIAGDDVRTGLTAADASAKTLYTTTAAGQLYRLMGRVLATAGTSPSATYTIKWTEGGATITKSLTISALDSDSDLSILIQPDNGTAITAQLTAISGTGTTVNVAATVEQMA